MNTLSVKNLEIWGRHGQTGDEPSIAQPFRIDITAHMDFSRVVESDSIKDTIDYKSLEAIARKAVENNSFVLLETLAGLIADQVLLKPRIQKVEVEITKIRPKTQGIPSVVVTKERNPVYLSQSIHDIDWPHVMAELTQFGGASVRLLTEPFRKLLLAEAELYKYEKQEEFVGPHKVREQLSSVTEMLPPGSLFYKLKEQLEDQILQKVAANGASNPFSTPFRFNEISLQRYDAGSIGITPHMDGRSVMNLITVTVLEGESKFALCEDRQGSNPHYLDTTPGNVIFMRSTGFLGSDYRPFHFVTDIPNKRTVVGIRQSTKGPYAWKKQVEDGSAEAARK